MNAVAPRRIYHLALSGEWQDAAKRQEPYRRSTLGESLDEVGFIHCSLAGQVETIADLVYRGRRDVLLLEIDTSQVHAEIRVENLEGGLDLFPHIYGELPIEAVIRVDPVPLGGDGKLVVTSLILDD